jgi:hypothetical protein
MCWMTKALHVLDDKGIACLNDKALRNWMIRRCIFDLDLRAGLGFRERAGRIRSAGRAVPTSTI